MDVLVTKVSVSELQRDLIVTIVWPDWNTLAGFVEF